jgi:hypothetical protein
MSFNNAVNLISKNCADSCQELGTCIAVSDNFLRPYNHLLNNFEYLLCAA